MAIIIISGGQTGVDRAALDAALAAGIPCGGWCPAGRLAEDGAIPLLYPLTELAGADYNRRTEQNVVDSDASVIVYFSNLFGGTQQTLDFCLQHRKPFLLIDADQTRAVDAAKYMRGFVSRHSITNLNIAGPRASEEKQAYNYASQTMTIFLAFLK